MILSKAGSMRQVGRTYHQTIEIQQKTITTGVYGAPVESWATFKEVRANVSLGSGREFFAARQFIPELSGLIQLRYISGITSDMRVIYQGDRILDLIGPPVDVGEEHREIELKVREIGRLEPEDGEDDDDGNSGDETPGTGGVGEGD